ncbi:putative 2OG-Fe(II) oxygenase [Shewanella salipaludis]|uniref:Uncharacterized protein n=1 Tax=Shewanella salipaludis TaxID=2723052 RepID=A0A972FQ74_9GAMM|nr:putative 2OG-Fe(II) oxygenase [Shewanella salipaludis]NMH64120.1 hypothetical protein [Shewanella salipaludis]
MEIKTLTKVEYLVGCLPEVDTQHLKDMILQNFHAGRFMDPDLKSIRREDVRINFTPEVQKLARLLCQRWKMAFDEDIELCWQNQKGFDPNTAYWSVVHGKGESTNVHDHASGENYEEGAKISAAFYVSVPPDSGDLVFQYNLNPYLVGHETVPAEEGKFVLFDSCLPHFVTKNLSDDYRVVISMNFRYKTGPQEDSQES